MSKLPPLPDRLFQAMRQEAKALVNKPSLPLVKAQEMVAHRHNFKNWQQVTLANNEFKRISLDYQENPVFFWDVKDFGGFDPETTGSQWTYDPKAVEFCYELLWKKSRIQNDYKDRMEWLVGSSYTGDVIQCDALYNIASDVFFQSPEYVFLKGCFIPFNELQYCSQDPRDIEKAETSLVIYDLIEPLLDKLHDSLISAVFDFSGRFTYDLGQISLYDSVGWTRKQAEDTIIDMDILQVILISPPDDVIASLKLVLDDHLVSVLSLDF